MIQENPIDYDNCRCLNCGEVYKVDGDNPYHVQQFCRKYCAQEFGRSLEFRGVF
jgi:hypothetical protein